MKTTKDRRLELDQKLRDILQKTNGKVNIYFQPPESVKMVYPCIRYSKSTPKANYADNRNYQFMQAYQILYIDKNPDNDVVDEIINSFQYARVERHYVMDHLNHDVIILYF